MAPLLGMTLALKDARIDKDQVDHVNAHATSTPAGDISELKALHRLFGNQSGINISATKSMTGHLLGAAGAIEAIATVKSIMHDTVPPTINCENPEPAFADHFDLTLNKPVNRTVDHAICNTFGFGGHIASSVFSKFAE